MGPRVNFGWSRRTSWKVKPESGSRESWMHSANTSSTSRQRCSSASARRTRRARRCSLSWDWSSELSGSPGRPRIQTSAWHSRRVLRRAVCSPRETSALMAGLLVIPAADEKPLVDYSPQKRRERTLETLLTWLLAVAHERPTLWVVEDLHWADPTTLEFLGSVLGIAIGGAAVGDPDVAARLCGTLAHQRPRVSSMTLTRLAPGETSSMAGESHTARRFPPTVLRQIVARAEGRASFRRRSHEGRARAGCAGRARGSVRTLGDVAARSHSA